jgi:hypothetical protein
MKTPQEIIEEQQGMARDRQLGVQQVDEKLEDRKFTLEIASKLLQFLRNETLKTKEVNPKDYDNALTAIEKAVLLIPKTDKVSVTNLTDYNSKLDAVLLAIKQIKIPEVTIPSFPTIPDNSKDIKAVQKAVESIYIPEVKIPETKEVDFSPLIKEVKLLGKSLDKSDTGDLKTQSILSAVLSQLEKGLSSIESGIQKLDREPELQLDRTDEVISALKGVAQTINDIKFPVPQISTTGIVDAINTLGGGFDPEADIDTTVTATTVVQTDGTKTYTCDFSSSPITERWT